MISLSAERSIFWSRGKIRAPDGRISGLAPAVGRLDADPKSFGAMLPEEAVRRSQMTPEAVLRVAFLRGLRVLRVKSPAPRP